MSTKQNTSLPTDADPALPHYERLSELSGQMLARARAQDWSAVVTLCLCYQQTVEEIKAFTGGKLAPHIMNTAKRHALLRKILSDDAHLRDLTKPELARLGKLLSTLSRQRTLHQTYGAF